MLNISNYVSSIGIPIVQWVGLMANEPVILLRPKPQNDPINSHSPKSIQHLEPPPKKTKKIIYFLNYCLVRLFDCFSLLRRPWIPPSVRASVRASPSSGKFKTYGFTHHYLRKPPMYFTVLSSRRPQKTASN